MLVVYRPHVQEVDGSITTPDLILTSAERLVDGRRVALALPALAFQPPVRFASSAEVVVVAASNGPIVAPALVEGEIVEVAREAVRMAALDDKARDALVAVQPDGEQLVLVDAPLVAAVVAALAAERP